MPVPMPYMRSDAWCRIRQLGYNQVRDAPWFAHGLHCRQVPKISGALWAADGRKSLVLVALGLVALGLVAACHCRRRHLRINPSTHGVTPDLVLGVFAPSVRRLSVPAGGFVADQVPDNSDDKGGCWLRNERGCSSDPKGSAHPNR